MSDPADRRPTQALRFFASAPHACSYLPDRHAASIFADPNARISAQSYSTLIEHGFRRSGCVIYRPQCPACNECLPVRLPVAQFRADRGQARTWRKNSDLRASGVGVEFNHEHYTLYRRYLAARHGDSTMADPSPEDYLGFLTCPGIDTIFVEFRADAHLYAVAAIDRIRSGLSSVYTFFDPDAQARGLGTFGILWTLAEARRLNLPYVYLGYWIKDCRKMTYKANFKPLEAYQDGQWRAVLE